MDGDNYNRRVGQYRRHRNSAGMERAAHDSANPDSNLASVSREGLKKQPGPGGPRTPGSIVASGAVKGAKAVAGAVKKLARKI
jgi:hypothetical protein